MTQEGAPAERPDPELVGRFSTRSIYRDFTAQGVQYFFGVEVIRNERGNTEESYPHPTFDAEADARTWMGLAKPLQGKA